MSGVIVSIILVLILEAFFSGTETAMVSCSRVRIRSLAEKGNTRAKIIWKMLQQPHRFLATTLLGTNLCVVTASALATSLCLKLFPRSGTVIATIIMVPLILIFGETVPKAIFRAQANRIILAIAPLISFFQKILFPVVIAADFLSNSIVRAMGIKRKIQPGFLSKEDIKIIVQQIADEGVLEEEEEETIHRVLDFRYRKVADVMVPLNKVVSVNYNNSRKEILAKTSRQGFTRFPVFREKGIGGVVNIFDLFYHGDDWHNYIRPLRQTEPQQRIDQLFSLLKPNKETMAAVVSKGRLIGIVTMEDIMEEIVTP